MLIKVLLTYLLRNRRLPYEERLQRLDLHSLYRSRLREDLIVAYEIFSLRIGSPPLYSASAAWLQRVFKVLQGSSRRLVGKISFSVRIVQASNSPHHFNH